MHSMISSRKLMRHSFKLRPISVIFTQTQLEIRLKPKCQWCPHCKFQTDELSEINLHSFRGSERSCSPIRGYSGSSSASSRSSSSTSSVTSTYGYKTKTYVTLDKKKAVVMASIKAKQAIPESHVKKVQQLYGFSIYLVFLRTFIFQNRRHVRQKRNIDHIVFFVFFVFFVHGNLNFQKASSEIKIFQSNFFSSLVAKKAVKRSHCKKTKNNPYV